MAYNPKKVWRVGRLIVGNGPGATSMALHSVGHRCDSDVDVAVMQIGSSEVKAFDWEKMPLNLPMGQKDHLLLRSGAANTDFTRVKDFLKFEKSTSNFSSVLNDGAIARVCGAVDSVKKFSKNEIFCRVRTPQGHQEVLCEEFIGSLGGGTERQVVMPIEHRHSKAPRGFHEFTTGIKSLTGMTPMIFGSVVVLFGDGPTVLWNALAYRQAGNEVFVIGPPGLKAFAGANPGGRNSAIFEELLAEDRLLTATPEGLVQRNNMTYFDDPCEPGMLLYLKNVRSIATGREFKTFVIPVSQIVSSIGSILSTLNLFDSTIVNDFKPVIMSGLVEQDYGVAIDNTDGDIIVIGAAAADASADFMARSLFAGSGDRIGQPDKGILVARHSAQMVQWISENRAKGGELGDLASSMHSLSRSLEVDPYTANSLQFNQFLLDYGMPGSDRAELIPALIEHRQKKVARGEAFSNYDLIKFINNMS